MKCNYLKLISRYIDNELPQEKNKFLGEHIPSCPDCRAELKNLTILRQGLNQNKITTNADFFLSSLKIRIEKEIQPQYRIERFLLDFGKWAKRLTPVPVLATILIMAW